MLGNTSCKYAQTTVRRIGVVFGNFKEQFGDFELAYIDALVQITLKVENVFKGDKRSDIKTP
jgi:hypothetical protein